MDSNEIAKKRAEIYNELAKHDDPEIRESVKKELYKKAKRKLGVEE